MLETGEFCRAKAGSGAIACRGVGFGTIIPERSIQVTPLLIGHHCAVLKSIEHILPDRQ
jgi:hypothetical protein